MREGLPTLSITPSSGKAGDQIYLRSSGWTPNADLLYEWPAIDFEQRVKADSQGKSEGPITIFEELAPGTYTIRMSEVHSPSKSAEAKFTCTNLVKRDDLFLWNGDFIGAGPAQKKFNLAWIGQLKFARLQVNFSGKFGWELQYVDLNGAKYYPQQTNVIDVGDVKGNLEQGDNSIVVHYSSVFGQQTTLTAKLILFSEFGVTAAPSINQATHDIERWIKENTIPAIVIMVVIAIISIAIAVIFSKIPGGLIKA